MLRNTVRRVPIATRAFRTTINARVEESQPPRFNEEDPDRAKLKSQLIELLRDREVQEELSKSIFAAYFGPNAKWFKGKQWEKGWNTFEKWDPEHVQKYQRVKLTQKFMTLTAVVLCVWLIWGRKKEVVRYERLPEYKN